MKEFITYLESEKNYSQHTIIAYENDLTIFSEFCKVRYGIESMDNVPYTVIRSWVVSLSKSKISNRSINRKIASLKAYYKFLQKIGKIQISPLLKHKALKTSKKIEVPFSIMEMNQVLSKIDYDNDFDGIRDKLLIHILYSTGIRRAELIHLKMAAVDIDSKNIKVVGKRNKERIIPLLNETIALTKEYLEHRKQLGTINDQAYFLLTKKGNKLYETLVYRIINGYFTRVSTKVKKSPHIIRHTFATHLLNLGADLNAVKELLGHTSLASTQVYTHSGIAELKKIHDKAHPRAKK